MTIHPDSPAAIAAAKAQKKVDACINAGRNFRLEAGAGAGKTYSLVQALKRLIADRGSAMLQAGQQVACITFTEVARDEIAQEIEKHPVILVETIHAFSWGFMAQFQKTLRDMVSKLDDRKDKIEAGGGVGSKPVEYSLGFFSVDQDKITLSHDDIPRFMAAFLDYPKFRKLLKRRFPVIFIDEYQDTNSDFMASIAKHFFAKGEGPLIGLFGDHWQTIYRGDYKLASYPNVDGIDKGANFRSAPAIVTVLNKLRPELPQQVSDVSLPGEVWFFHTNAYNGLRTNTPHSKDDLPDAVAREFTTSVRARLQKRGWDFRPEKTKILMLTHNVLAAQQGYPNIAKIFKRNEAFAKKEDPLIAFFADVLEPMFDAYLKQRYGEMFRILGNTPSIKKRSDKLCWQDDMKSLLRLREHNTIGEVVDYVQHSRHLHLPDKITRREEELKRFELQRGGEEKGDEIAWYRQLRDIPYREVIQLVRFLNGSTPFATKHSVKGAQFENVLVILGGGWNHYNWPRFFELFETKKLTTSNESGYYRARNLFYVSISRPERRLAVLATQTLSKPALAAVHHIFGSENVHDLSA